MIPGQHIGKDVEKVVKAYFVVLSSSYMEGLTKSRKNLLQDSCSQDCDMNLE
jgi:hypothetical protein